MKIISIKKPFEIRVFLVLSNYVFTCLHCVRKGFPHINRTYPNNVFKQYKKFSVLIEIDN